MAEKSGKLSRQDGGVQLNGQFDHDSILAVKSEGETLIRSLSGRQPFRVDLSGVSATDSVFVALLLSWFRLCEARSVPMELAGAPKRLLDMARVSGVDAVLPFEDASTAPQNDPVTA